MLNPTVEDVSRAMKRAEYLERNSVQIRGIDLTFIVSCQMAAERMNMAPESLYLRAACSKLRELAFARV